MGRTLEPKDDRPDDSGGGRGGSRRGLPPLQRRPGGRWVTLRAPGRQGIPQDDRGSESRDQESPAPGPQWTTGRSGSGKAGCNEGDPAGLRKDGNHSEAARRRQGREEVRLLLLVLALLSFGL